MINCICETLFSFTTKILDYFLDYNKSKRWNQNIYPALLLWPTFAWLIVDADGLGLVLAVVSLHTDQMGVRGLIEARPNSQHMLVGLIQSLH